MDQSTFQVVRNKDTGLLKKLVIVGTVAAACVVSTLYMTATPTILGGGVSFLSQPAGEVEQAFIHFIAKYGKTYASKTELPRRFEIFQANYLLIQAHNARPEALYTMEVNKFADMSDEEFAPISLNVEDLLDDTELAPRLREEKYTKETIDWRATDKLMPVKDQGTKCHSDWAFAAATAIESAAAILND
jgi:Cathepsin propeptide inhibitor domain (I29)/Papain family cysteine protease